MKSSYESYRGKEKVSANGGGGSFVFRPDQKTPNPLCKQGLYII